jgi:hypothetical protein
MLRKVVHLSLVPILMFLMALTGFGQATDGALSGKVIDPTGAVITGASVNVVNKDTGLKLDTTTDAQGFFRFEHLPIGTYNVTSKAEGFGDTVVSVAISLNQVSDIALKMTPGGGQEIVEVSGSSEVLVETSTATLGNAFDARKVVDLPAQNGSELELALLAPNVSSQSGGTAGEGGSVGGNRPRNNSFNLDGVDNNDSIVTGHVINVIPEAVGEFTLLTNEYTAEFGHSSAGQFNTITKSGTNEFHGSINYDNNNKDLNALDNITEQAIHSGNLSEKPRFDFNRLSATIGGPLIKNKLFFFGAFQYKTDGTAGTASQFFTPTAAGFAQLSQISGTSPFTLGLLQQFVAPAGANDAGSVTVLGKSIPVGSVNILSPSFNNEYTFNVNIDQVIGANNQLRYRYNYDRSSGPSVGDSNPIFTGSGISLNQLASFTFIHTFRPNLLNEFRFSYRRQNFNLGIPGQFTNFPNIEIDELNFDLGPNDNAPQGGISNLYQYVDNISYTKGKHNFKGGVEFRNNVSPQNFLPRARGEYDYASLEEFATDIKPGGLDGGLRGVGTSTFAANNIAFYTFFQDDFHATPNLTFNLGVRYEYTSIFRDEKLQALNDIASVPGMIVFRKPDSDKNNFSPRIGVAYSPSGKGKITHYLFGDAGQSSIRAGFGISYDVAFGNLATLQLPPQFQQELDAAAGNGGAFGTNTGFLQNGGLGNTPVPPTTTADARAVTSTFIPDKVTPYVVSYTLGYQRQLGKDYSVEFRYLGTEGVKLNGQVRLNAPNPAGVLAAIGGHGLPIYTDPSQVPSVSARDGMLTLGDIQNVAINSLPLGNFGFFTPTVTAFLPVGHSNYNAGSVAFNKRFSKGYTFSANYTYSHTIDNGTNDLFTSLVNPRRSQDFNNISADRGTSALSRTSRFVADGIYELPLGKNLKSRIGKALVQGFQISAIYTAESGQPFSALSGTDTNVNFDSAGDRAITNPNGIGNTGSPAIPIRNSNGGTVGYLIANPSARFYQAGAGTFASTTGAGTLRAPGINNWDFTIIKRFAFTEQVKLEFRASLLDAFNHPQYIIGNGSVIDPGGVGIAQATAGGFATVGSGTFNTASSLFEGRPRSVLLGLRLNF